MTTRRELFALSGAALVATAFPATAQDTAAPQGSVRITQIRNATLHVVYGGVRFLVEPMLSDRHAWPGFEGSVNSAERNPLVHLPMTKEEIIDVDAVIVTHLHEDHWDEEAAQGPAEGAARFCAERGGCPNHPGTGFLRRARAVGYVQFQRCTAHQDDHNRRLHRLRDV
jgi:glyoxylase-like metal-dependent hydrolase (beta-lactamase superfamily II)